MGIAMRLALASAAAGLAAFALVGSAQASTAFIDFSVSFVGGDPMYAGATLNTSTAFDFGGGLYQVNQVATGDQSGLIAGNLVSLTSPVTYGSGSSGSTSLTKTWTDAFGTFTETMTSFTADRSSANAITLDFAGTLTSTSGINEPAFMILSANQVGGPGHVVGWTLTNTSVSPTPLPAALPLFATGLGAMGLLGWRRKRKAAAIAA